MTAPWIVIILLIVVFAPQFRTKGINNGNSLEEDIKLKNLKSNDQSNPDNATLTKDALDQISSKGRFRIRLKKPKITKNKPSPPERITNAPQRITTKGPTYTKKVESNNNKKPEKITESVANTVANIAGDAKNTAANTAVDDANAANDTAHAVGDATDAGQNIIHSITN